MARILAIESQTVVAIVELLSYMCSSSPTIAQANDIFPFTWKVLL